MSFWLQIVYSWIVAQVEIKISLVLATLVLSLCYVSQVYILSNISGDLFSVPTAVS